jgi:hypothetical protein
MSTICGFAIVGAGERRSGRLSALGESARFGEVVGPR